MKENMQEKNKAASTKQAADRQKKRIIKMW
jgi:hypothetical protein